MPKSTPALKQNMDLKLFSKSYAEAQSRFIALAQEAQATLYSYPLAGRRAGQRAEPRAEPRAEQSPDGGPLSIDVAVIEPSQDAAAKKTPNAQGAFVVSSGLHGVEGYLGSAFQLKILTQKLWQKAAWPNVRLVLVHALNPFGFAWDRRVNEANIDLNRNFLISDAAYQGSPKGYAQLDSLLNPKGPPPVIDAFLLKALWQIARQGMPALKDAVAGGQYDFPQGLFFGGQKPAFAHQVLKEHLNTWLLDAAYVWHLDVHTGIGPWGDYRLLVDRQAQSDAAQHLQDRFGKRVEPWQNDGVAYQIQGGLGAWCKHHSGKRPYEMLLAEVGTYAPLKVIAALREENRCFQHLPVGDPKRLAAGARLRKVFAPTDEAWRQSSMAHLDALLKTLTEAGKPPS